MRQGGAGQFGLGNARRPGVQHRGILRHPEAEQQRLDQDLRPRQEARRLKWNALDHRAPIGAEQRRVGVQARVNQQPVDQRGPAAEH